MVALGEHLTGHAASPAEIAAEDGDTFQTWLSTIAALVASLQCTLDPDCIVLGDNDLGPQVWRAAPAAEAMAKAETLVADYVLAGFTKIHLDCSEGCQSEPAQLDDAPPVARAAQLAAICEQTTPDPTKLSYMVGTEVVQSGVEFTSTEVHHFHKGENAALRAMLAPYEGLCFEAHSTDCRHPSAYLALAEMGFSIHKVGLALTHAYRQALYALDEACASPAPDIPRFPEVIARLLPASRTMAQLQRLRVRHIPVLLTLAPEAVTQGQVAEIVAPGVTVSLGHTTASAAEACALFAEGATLFTHLFNAMSQMENRAPGVVGVAINSHAYCSIIADGLHVDPAMLALAYRARPLPDHMILITDAMPTVGGPDEFSLYGEMVHLKDGKIINPQGLLTGAHVTIPEGIAMMQTVGISQEDALRMATCNPAKLMGLEEQIGRLIGAEVSDLIMMSDTSEISALGLSGKAASDRRQTGEPYQPQP